MLLFPAASRILRKNILQVPLSTNCEKLSVACHVPFSGVPDTSWKSLNSRFLLCIPEGLAIPKAWKKKAVLVNSAPDRLSVMSSLTVTVCVPPVVSSEEGVKLRPTSVGGVVSVNCAITIDEAIHRVAKRVSIEITGSCSSLFLFMVFSFITFL